MGFVIRTVAAIALATLATLSAAQDADDAVRDVLRKEAYRPGQEQRLGTLVRLRPTLAYQVAIELCEAGVLRVALGDPPAGDFEAAEHLGSLIGDRPEAKGINRVARHYRSFDRATANSWVAAYKTLNAAEQALERDDPAEAMRLTTAAGEAINGLEDPLLGARFMNVAGMVARDWGKLERAQEYLATAALAYRDLGDAAGRARATGNLASVERRRGNYEHALQLSADTRLLASVAGDMQVVADEWADEGLIHNRMGRYREAIESYSKALETRPNVSALRHRRAVVVMNLGLVHENLGNMSDAVARMNEALDILGDSPDNAARRATVNANLANLAANRGDLAGARMLFQSSLRTFESRHIDDKAAMTRLNLGMLDLLQGDPASALARFNSAVDFAKASGQPQLEAQALIGIAEASRSRADARKAMEIAARACGQPQALPIRVACERLIAAAEADIGELESSARHYLRAVELVDALYAMVGDPSDLGTHSFYAPQRHVYREAIDVLMRLHALRPSAGHDRSAFEVSESSKSRVFQEQLRRAGFPATMNQPQLNDLVSAERKALARVAQLNSQIRSFRPAPGNIAWAQLVSAQAAAVADLKQARRALSERLPPTAREGSGISVEGVRASIAPGEAVLSYSLGMNDSYVFILRRNSFSAHRLGVTPTELMQAVSSLRRGLEIRGDRTEQQLLTDLRTFDPRSASALRAKLLPAPAITALTGARRLFVSGDGPLYLLPFGALVDESFDPGRLEAARDDKVAFAEFRAVPFIADRYQLRYVPSVFAFTALRAQSTAPGAWAEPVIAFADPVVEPGMSRLAESADEARQVAKLLKAGPHAVFLRERATRANVRSAQLQRARFLLFSTHGFAGDDDAGEPALVLTRSPQDPRDNGMLSMSEIMGLELRSELVVLSACNTAGAATAAVRQGEGFAGLVRSFIYAGSRGVLATQWNVLQTGARDFVVTFFEHAVDQGFDEGMARAAAKVRSTSIPVRSGMAISLSHPAFWSAFVLVGS